MQSPDEMKRTAMLQWISRKYGVSVDADLSHVAAQTSGFVYADLVALVFHAVRYVIFLGVFKQFLFSIKVCSSLVRITD
jgi:SpoVK/Ycf46/Vps4 family AAA+-type ATPase